MFQKDTFFMRHLHLFILGAASVASLGALAALSYLDTTRLNSFGPTAKLYFIGIKNGLKASTAILIISFSAALFFKEHLHQAATRFHSLYAEASETKKNVLILALCLAFAFAAHAGGVMNGYFNMDDFEVISMNRTMPLSQAIFVPHGNDHALPLFRTEMKTLDMIFGQNPMPYNIFLFLMFALVPFFTYLSFKKLGLGLPIFTLFLILFTGATEWDELVPGFYIMSIYLQIIFFFSVALWSYLSWMQVREKKYMLLLALSLAGALTIDISGLWTLPAIVLGMMYASYAKADTFAIKKRHIAEFFRENRVPLVVVSEVIIAFAIYFIYTFYIIQPGTFLSVLNGQGSAPTQEAINYKTESWKPAPLTENFLSLFANGVMLSFFAPKIARIAGHPAIAGSVQAYWPLLETILLLAAALLLWFTLKYADMKEKKLSFLFLGIMTIPLLMVILARPDHSAIPDFDYRYAGAAFYAYCLLLALSASVFLKRSGGYAAKIIIPAVIIIFSAQQVFSFQSVRTNEESRMRKIAIEGLNKNLLSAIESMGKEKKGGPLTVPNLDGGHIFEQTMAGFSLSHYILFFNRPTPLRLIRTEHMPQDRNTVVTTVQSLRASTSPEFKEALRTPGAVRNYYLSPRLISYATIISSTTPISQNTDKEIVLQEKVIDPEQTHMLALLLTTDDIEGNVELLISFKNDFSWETAAGKIRVDDFTPHEAKDGKRIYRIQADLLQLYAYALSENVSRITISVPETKNASVSDVILK